MPKWFKVRVEWGRLRKELYHLYYSFNIIRTIQSRRMNVASMGCKREVIQNLGSGNLRERYHWKDIGVEGNIILKWIFIICFGEHGLY